MEYIEVVTENGIKTGEIKSRKDIHAKGNWHKTVHIWIVNKNCEVLLQKRAASKESHPGLWDIACAGHISAHETSLQAAIKELYEELGIRATEKDLSFLFSQKTSFTENNGRYINNEIHDTYLLLKDIPASTIRIQKSEVEEVRYFSFEEFCKCVQEKDPSLVAHLEEYDKMVSFFKEFSYPTDKY